MLDMVVSTMSLIEQRIKANANELKQTLLAELRKREPHQNYTGPALANEKEEPAMRVSYNGFIGELFKLERNFDIVRHGIVYKLDIRDHEKEVTYSFDKVKLSDVKFLGGVVSFGE